MNALNSDQTFSILTLILNENQCHRTVHILKEENVPFFFSILYKFDRVLLNVFHIESF